MDVLRPGARGAVLAVLLAGSGACYNPDILDGGLMCGPADACPKDFRCENRGTGKRCYRTGAAATDGAVPDRVSDVVVPDAVVPDVIVPDLLTEGGGDRTPDTAAEMPRDGMIDGPPPDMPSMCVGPLPACSAAIMPGQVCDPVCQAGCACDQRCELPTTVARCAVPPDGELKRVGQACNFPPDDCAPGLGCLADGCGSRCYRYCRTDAQCGPRAKCTLDVADGMGMRTGFKICDVENSGCDPVGPPARTNCGSGFGCYPIDVRDETGCDCAGTLPEGATCQYERECLPGFVCMVRAQGQVCTRVCRIGAMGGCPLSTTCQPLSMTSMRFGACI